MNMPIPERFLILRPTNIYGLHSALATLITRCHMALLFRTATPQAAEAVPKYRVPASWGSCFHLTRRGILKFKIGSTKQDRWRDMRDTTVNVTEHSRKQAVLLPSKTAAQALWTVQFIPGGVKVVGALALSKGGHADGVQQLSRLVLMYYLHRILITKPLKFSTVGVIASQHALRPCL